MVVLEKDLQIPFRVFCVFSPAFYKVVCRTPTSREAPQLMCYRM